MKKTLFSTTLLLCASLHANTPLEASTTAQAIQAPTLTQPVPSPETPKPIVNCLYAIPPEKTIDADLLSTWATKAAIQSFEFTPETIDAQLEALKPCFTTQGWQGFFEALTASGNINAIKTQQLLVTAQLDGEPAITPIKDNQWKVILPMHVVYNNDKERLTQRLTIELRVGRNASGSLGIIQLIAIPHDVTPENRAS
jgi:hypothetical protein